jgi:hypothetical protein
MAYHWFHRDTRRRVQPPLQVFDPDLPDAANPILILGFDEVE